MLRLRRFGYYLTLGLLVAWIVSPLIGAGLIFHGASSSGSIFSMAGSVRFLYADCGTKAGLPIEPRIVNWRKYQDKAWNGELTGTLWRSLGFGYIVGKTAGENYRQQNRPMYQVFVPHWMLFAPGLAVIARNRLRQRQPSTAGSNSNATKPPG